MRFFLMSSFMMINVFTGFSQNQGVVTDIDNNPLEKVNVYFPDNNSLLITDDNGIFFIDEVIGNNEYVHFSKQGYSSRLIKYKKDEPFEIILEKLHVTLDEVGVVESYNELGNSKLTNIEKKLLTDVFINSPSMVENITELTGVDMISSGLGIQKIVVRGLSGMRVVTYLNGMKINNQQWANDHGIGFTDLGLGEVELIKGASALRFGGEAIGGLLYFKDEPFLSSKKPQGFLATKFNNSSYLSSSQFGLKLNKNNFYFNIYGQYSISSDYRLPNNDYLYNSRFKQAAVKLSLSHRYKNMQNILRYQFHTEATGIPAHIHGDPTEVDLLDITSSSLDLSLDYDTARPSQFINNHLIVYESNYIKNNLKFSLRAGHFINNLVEWEKWTRPAFDLTISHTQLMPNIRMQLDEFTFNLGSNISILENINGEGDDKLVPDANTSNIGPYLTVDYEDGNIGFNSGIRYDYKSIKSKDEMLVNPYDEVFSSTSLSSGIYYKYLDNVFRLTYSGAFRAPHFSELFSNGVHHGTNRYEIGEINLEIEKANQIDLKYQWSNNHLGIVVNPFIQSISDYITLNPVDSFINGNRVYEYYQVKQAEFRGVEMNIHYHPHQLHSLHLEQSYSFLQTVNNDSEYGLALTPANSIKTKALLDFNEFKKLVNYKLDFISLDHKYKFKQESFAEYEELTEDYNVVNIHLGFKFNERFRSVISVNNLLNEEYSPHISRIRGVAGGVPNPGRFFNINLKYDF